MRSMSFVFAVILIAVGSADAAVRFADWTPETLGPLLERAGDSGQTVMVVVTQPDWCPPCIRLDREIFSNPDERDFSNLSSDWLMLEIFGYDEEGAELLRTQNLKFHGTPTTFIMKPRAGDDKLGELPIATSVVGFPEDYVKQVRKAAKGYDRLAMAQKRVRKKSDLESWRELADVYVSRGDVTQARLAFQSILLREDLTDEERKKIEWDSIVTVTQRVEKDHRAALEAIEQYGTRYPGETKSEDYAYARAWSLMSLGQNDAAREVLHEAFIAPGTVDGLATFLYIVFRNPSEGLLEIAEELGRDGLERFPDSTARLSAGLGRILRRQGRLAEAEDAFVEAVRLTGVEEDNYAVYAGQLEFVRQQLAAGGTEPDSNLK